LQRRLTEHRGNGFAPPRRKVNESEGARPSRRGFWLSALAAL